MESSSSSPSFSVLRKSKRLSKRATSRVILLLLAAAAMLHLTFIYHLHSFKQQTDTSHTSRTNPFPIAQLERVNSISAIQRNVKYTKTEKDVLGKVVYVAHVSVPLADQKGSDGRLEQVLDVLSTLLHDPTKQLGYIGFLVEGGQREAHLQRLKDKFRPGMVITHTGWKEHEIWESIRRIRDEFAPCDELLVFFWPTIPYWQWITKLVRIIQEEMGPNKCKVTMMIDESFWERWRYVQGQVGAAGMARDFSWMVQDWRLLRINMLHFLDGMADKIALINQGLMDEYTRILPKKSEKGLFLLPYVGARSGCSLQNVSNRKKSGLLVVSGPQGDYVHVLYNFVVNVFDSLPPDRIGTLHVVGMIRNVMEPNIRKEDWMLLNHPRIIFHGQVSEAELERLESEVITALNPGELSLGGVSTKIIRSMSRCVAIVYTKNSLPPASSVASAKLRADIQSPEFGVACDSRVDFACFRNAILRLAIDNDHRSRVVHDHHRYATIEFSEKKLAANVLHWLGMHPEDINRFHFRSVSTELPPAITKTTAIIGKSEPTKLSSDDIVVAVPLLRKTVRGVYVTALLKDVSSILDHFSHEVVRFVEMALLGAQNNLGHLSPQFDSVFIKFVTSNNEDDTEEKLRLLKQRIIMLRDSGILPSGATLDIEVEILGKEQDGRYSKPEFKDNRPAYLAHMRNRAINRLDNRHSHVLFINDVITTAEDMMRLIMTRNGDYDMACAMDFKLDTWTLRTDMRIIHSPGPKNLTFYDVWVARTTQGLPMTSRYPWFSNDEDIHAMKQHQPVQVFSCWNGMVSIKSKVFLQTGIKFRTKNHHEKRRDGNRIAYSEAYVIGADLWDHGFTGVFVNPCIQVAYDWPTWEEINRSTYYTQCQERRTNRFTSPLPSLTLRKSFIITTQPKTLSLCKPVEQTIEEKDSKGSTIPISILVNEPDWAVCGPMVHHHMRSVLFRGQLLQRTSVGDVNRNFIQGLFGMQKRASHVPVRVRVLLDGEPYNQVVRDLHGVPESERSFLQPGVVLHEGVTSLELSGETFDLCISSSWPPNFSRCPASRRTVLWLAWEYGHLPKHYVPQMNSAELDEIWVPSSHAKRYFVASGVDSNKIFVVPSPVSEDLSPRRIAILEQRESMTLKKSTSTTTFVYVGGTMSRKGLDLALRAYEEEFTAGDPVCLHVYAAHPHIINAVTEKLRDWQSDKNRPCLRWFNDYLPRDALLEKMRNADILLQPYRSEGFGTTLIEAMVFGIPVITTAGGVSNDFIVRMQDPSNVLSTITLPILVNSRSGVCTVYPCKPTKDGSNAELCMSDYDTQRCRPLTDNPVWRLPDLKDIRRKMRLGTEQHSTWRHAARMARKTLFNRFSSTNIANHVVRCHIDGVQSGENDCRRRW